MRIEPEKNGLITNLKDPNVLKISRATTVESGDLTLDTGNIVLTAGNITQTGDQAVTGDLTLTGDLLGTGAITRTGDSTITGDILGTGALTRTGDSTITGDVLGTGDITRTGDVTLLGSTGVSIAPVSADTGVAMKVICKQVLHTIVGGGITETLTSAIPANSYVFGVQSKIKTTITMTTGVSFLIGVTGDTNRFGDHTALTQNDVQTPGDHEIEAHGLGRYYNTATNILLTGNAGTFDAVGLISVIIYFVDLSPPDNFS